MCSLVPLRKAAYVWYRTMTAILLRRERGRNNAEVYAVLVVTPPPLQREVTFQKGGRNDARVRYMCMHFKNEVFHHTFRGVLTATNIKLPSRCVHTPYNLTRGCVNTPLEVPRHSP